MFVRLLWAAVIACACNVPAAADSVRVARVLDGDSLRVHTNGRLETIRIFGIDAPERGQPGGELARSALVRLVGTSVVEVDRVDRDRYGRTVAHVQVNGRDVALAMVREGHAWQFTRYDKGPILRTAQDAARRERIGLWGGAGAEAPWQWRSARTSNVRADREDDCRPAPSCARMTSCGEALAILARCGSSRLDGDRDGIPCEAICVPSA